MAEGREVSRETIGEGIHISDEVVGIIAGIAASEVPGLAGMSGGLASGLSEALRGRSFGKGVRVTLRDRRCVIDLYVIVRYGARIPDVAMAVQQAVKRAVEAMTGLEVERVNVHVQGIDFGSDRGPRAEARAPEEKEPK
ncbi:MAG: Asp23/Gls24 family envelope stress response protein [Bacillota bacterium]|nr:Asp23/Gls24 family envelope stress response protein [Bacillota bacterium]